MESEHKRVILHLDIDYFYAQVEELLNPELKSIPFGVKQGQYVVTCNYVARDRGVGKWKKISECLEKCPELKLVPGEDLQNYKKFSKKLHNLMQEIFPNETTERLGLDELFIDVTSYVENRMEDEETVNFSGPILPDEDAFAKCDCGCERRLRIGSMVASYTRKKVFDEIGLTCSVGVAHNKILSKLVGQMNKPNNSTVLAPVHAKSFMSELKDIRNIMGIGKVIEEKLKGTLNIHTIVQLQNCEFDVLQKEFGNNMASRLKQLANGIDSSVVKQSGKAKSIGLESSFRPVSAGSDITENFQSLFTRLLVQVKDDSRIPQTLRVTVRKYDAVKKASSRESRQSPFPPNCFKLQEGKVSLTEGSETKIMQTIMRLFNRMVDKSQSYKITLIGLCCSNFQTNPGSIDKFLINKSHDIEVQSQTDINYGDSLSRALQRSRLQSISPLIDNEEVSSNVEVSDAEEDALEAPTKKLKVKILEDQTAVASSSECPSPSAKLCDISGIKISCNAPQIDTSVWNEIPTEIQQELMSNWQKIVATTSTTKQATKRVSTDSKIHKYFIKIPK